MKSTYLDSLSYQAVKTSSVEYLVLMLHGWGANYNDLQPLAEVLDLPNCRFLFPNAPFEHFQMPTGRAWYALERQDFQGIEESRDRLSKWLDSLPALTGIPPERTAMVGFSQGGAMTLDVGLMFNFAAVCSCSGYLHYNPLERSGNFPPTLLIHGTQDTVVPLTAAKKAKKELTQIGVETEYFEFMGGHEIPTAAMVSMRNFLQHTLMI
ncbi:phospholipase/Carboxylesterase [[Leptolyngbya] sp. PCC 7376]|uniref:alpha/beta hydrolase n=1 Tax=[Leptolyngbya] sp. PCC 7376 TaxID=111781 RepID=UPI00029EEA92|nr:phospholipase/carboxylesterase [[Leptolyngbya] sp. PCC 7376]AFY37161.1 phospholipase/Carboxylesterase [[Leptolyngbya] sp. PCC 7376]